MLEKGSNLFTVMHTWCPRKSFPRVKRRTLEMWGLKAQFRFPWNTELNTPFNRIREQGGSAPPTVHLRTDDVT